MGVSGAPNRSVGEYPTWGAKGTSARVKGGELKAGGIAGAAGEGPGRGGGFSSPARPADRNFDGRGEVEIHRR